MTMPDESMPRYSRRWLNLAATRPPTLPSPDSESPQRPLDRPGRPAYCNTATFADWSRIRRQSQADRPEMLHAAGHHCHGHVAAIYSRHALTYRESRCLSSSGIKRQCRPACRCSRFTVGWLMPPDVCSSKSACTSGGSSLRGRKCDIGDQDWCATLYRESEEESQVEGRATAWPISVTRSLPVILVRSVRTCRSGCSASSRRLVRLLLTPAADTSTGA